MLVTCNRTELFAVAAEPVAAERAMSAALVAYSRIGRTELARARYVHRDDDAVRHLLRVAASLDSMIVGESEIQGQVRAAMVAARDAGTMGPVLERAFRQALRTGRRVRRETRIGAGTVSVSSVAADLARTALGELTGRRALLVGAGRTAEATAGALLGGGLGEVVVANRTAANATRLARRFGGRAVALHDLTRELAAADVVIASTGAPAPMLDTGIVAPAMVGRRHPLVVIDIAVPRDVAAGVGALPGVHLHDSDDLERLAAVNRAERHAEAQRAEAIVEDELRRFACHDADRRGRLPRTTIDPSTRIWTRTASDVCG